MGISREEAKSWSVERIKVELDFLFKELQQFKEEKKEYLEWFEEEYKDPLKKVHHDPNASIISGQISECESDIEFLKNLLRKKVG
jgi:vacuolar-type H+-ATPase subunit E/Vma4